MSPMRRVTVMASVWACCTVPAFAAGPPVPDEVLQKLQAMDTDHDNRLSYEEIAHGYYANVKNLTARFSQLDANGNGIIDRGEVGPVVFSRLDLDGNGSVRPDEFMAASSARARDFVVKSDTNKDGYITVDELTAGVKTAVDSAGATYDEMAGAYNQRGPRRTQLFRALDQSGDGSLEAAEWPDARSFAAVDTTHDGRISGEEFMAAHAAVTAALVKAVDLNRDGKVTVAEVRRYARMTRDKQPR